MNIAIKNVSLEQSSTLKDALENLKESGQKIVLIIDDEAKLLGLLTDGDIRNAILDGADMSTSLSKIMNTNPLVMPADSSVQNILITMSNRDLYHIPLVDKNGVIVDLKSRPKKDILKQENTVVIMAGGEGLRMRPLTEDTPKPLLEIENKPILEIILDQFISQGFYNFVFSVNYKKQLIVDYFGDGSRMGVNISYIEEINPMGTAGSLSLLKSFTAPMIVMNADILTKANFINILQHHEKQVASEMTMAVRPHEYKISYGVVNHVDGKILGIEEKPVKTFHFNAGIYVLSESIIKEIPKHYFDMTMLLEKAIEKKIESSIYVLNDYWMDIGQMEDYKRAQNDYSSIFKD